jgi:hypothetical protein
MGAIVLYSISTGCTVLNNHFHVSAGFMQNKDLIVIFAAVIGLIFLTCSSLDTYTTAGSDVIDEYDPTLTNFNENFYPIAFNNSIVTEARSITSDDTSHLGGIHKNILAAGSAGGSSMYGYSEFIVSKSFAALFDSSRKFDSVTFLFDTLSGDQYESGNTLNSSARMYLFAATRSDLYNRSIPDTSEEKALCTLKPFYTIPDTNSGSDTAFRFSGKCEDSKLTDSIFHVLTAFIDCAVDDDAEEEECDTIKDTLFSMALYSRTAPIWFSSNTAMIIHSTRREDAGTNTTRADTIHAASFYIVKENDSLRAAHADRPLSCYNSGRAAVFKIDFSAFWDSVAQSGFDEILSASIVLEADTLVTGSINNASRILYAFTDSLIADFGEFMETIGYAYTYSSQNITMDTCTSANKLVIPLSGHLQRNQDRPKDEYYLYLQIESTNISIQQEILWKKPQLKAILTTTR